MKSDNKKVEQEISLYTENGRKIETKVIWDYRLSPGNEFVVTRGFETSIFMMTHDEWHLFVDMIHSLPMNIPDTKLLGRYFIASAIDIVIDDQLAMIVPSDLLKHAGIENKAVIRGKEGFAQIISASNFEKMDWIDGVEALRARLMFKAAIMSI